MLNRSYFSMKIRYLILGIVIGIVIMSSALVFANTPISAWVANNIGLYFNNQFTELPQGYDVILYNGRAYTPARFVAEELGAEVIWDEGTNRIYINYEEKVSEATSKTQEKDGEFEEKESTENNIENRNYQKLPINITAEGARIAITSIQIDDKETMVYLEIEGRKSYPVQLNQGATVMEIGDMIYKQTDVKDRDPVDMRWYNDIRDEERISGWIKLPAVPEDTDTITLYLEVLRNDGSNETTELEFDIAL